MNIFMEIVNSAVNTTHIQLPLNDPLLIFSLVMINVLIAPIIAERLKMPGIIGLIISGVIFGPHLFGILERDKTIELLGTIGLLYIMFQAGLEINLGEVKKNKSHSFAFGLMTFMIPLLLGICAAKYILNLGMMESVLLASMFSSHTLLTFPIVSKNGLVKRKAVATTIGGTIITDVLALLILAVVINIHRESANIYFWIKMFVMIFIYTISVIYFLPKITRWFFKRYSNENGNEEYVFIFASLFIISYLAHTAGLEPIIGAFLTGLTLNRMVPEKSILMNRIHFIGSALFIPFFLVSVGMIIDPKMFFSDINTLKVSLVMIVVAVFSKYSASHIFGKLFNYSKNERNLIFGLSVNQAAATLAAVLIGYEAEIFDESILSGTIMMIVVTTFVGAIITNRAARKNLIENDEKNESNEKNLDDRILIPVKNSKNMLELMDLAFYLQEKTSIEPVYPLNVVIESSGVEEEIEKSEELLTKAIVRANALNKNIMPLTKLDTNIVSAINKSSKEYRISKVIFGLSDKHIFKDKIFGSLSENYIKNSKEMVFLTRISHSLNASRNILLIIPPLINRQRGFEDSFNTVVKLANSLSDGITVILEERTKEEMESLLFAVKNVEIKFKVIVSWKNIEESISEIITESDLIIQINARSWELAWRLEFDKMAVKIANRFNKNNMITLFPYSYSEEDGDIIKKAVTESKFIEKLSKENFYFDLNVKNWEEYIEFIIKENFKIGSIFIIKQLKEVLYNNPIELSEEIELVHIHSRIVKKISVFIAVKESGLISRDGEKIKKIIVIIVSPKDADSRHHLQTLSDVIKLLRDKKIVNIILNAKNYEMFIEEIKKI